MIGRIVPFIIQTYTKKYTKKYTKCIPTNVPKIHPRYIQDVQDKYKIPSCRRPGPARAKPGAAIYLDVFVVYIFLADWDPICIKL